MLAVEIFSQIRDFNFGQIRILSKTAASPSSACLNNHVFFLSRHHTQQFGESRMVVFTKKIQSLILLVARLYLFAEQSSPLSLTLHSFPSLDWISPQSLRKKSTDNNLFILGKTGQLAQKSCSFSFKKHKLNMRSICRGSAVLKSPIFPGDHPRSFLKKEL